MCFLHQCVDMEWLAGWVEPGQRLLWESRMERKVWRQSYVFAGELLCSYTKKCEVMDLVGWGLTIIKWWGHTREVLMKLNNSWSQQEIELVSRMVMES